MFQSGTGETPILSTYFISHGAGPWPYIEGDFRARHASMEASLRDIPHQLPETPASILMVSGHWVEPDFTVMANPAPPMMYDYSGFPEHTYTITYPAAGSPKLAQRVRDVARAANFNVSLDVRRGFDHGAFVPLFVMYPNAEIPVVQLSLRGDYDAAAHFELGQALAPLRSEGVLIIGSGLSYHNLRRFSQSGAQASREFDHWLKETLSQSDSKVRRQKLIQWTTAPSAREAHPDEDHFLPLLVVAGAAEMDPVHVIHHQDDFFGALAVSSFRFGN